MFKGELGTLGALDLIQLVGLLQHVRQARPAGLRAQHLLIDALELAHIVFYEPPLRFQ